MWDFARGRVLIGSGDMYNNLRTVVRSMDAWEMEMWRQGRLTRVGYKQAKTEDPGKVYVGAKWGLRNNMPVEHGYLRSFQAPGLSLSLRGYTS